MHVLFVKIKPQNDRLDQYVAAQLKNISRSKANKLVKEGNILVNGARMTPAYRVRKADKISIEIPPKSVVSLQAENIPLKIVFEDKDLVVVDKQPGLVVHPTVNHPSGTLVNAIISHLRDLPQDNFRPGIVHRLDKDTSGLMVIAKNPNSLEFLKKQFQAREVEKSYIALVGGSLAKEKGIIETSIERHPKFKQMFAVSKEGKPAKTEYKIFKRYKKYTLLTLRPLTGRTHQLRVHLSSIGHPIVGDKLYGGRMLLSRQFLHASQLSFAHPKKLKKLTFVSELPEQLSKILEKLDPL